MSKNDHLSARLSTALFTPSLVSLGFGLLLFSCSAADGEGEREAASAESALVVSTPVSAAEGWDLGLVTVRNRDPNTNSYCMGAVVSADWVITSGSDCLGVSGYSGIVRATRADGAVFDRAILRRVRVQDQDNMSMLWLAPATEKWPTVTRNSYSGANTELNGKEVSCYGRGADGSTWRKAVGTVTVNSWNEERLVFPYTGTEVTDSGAPCMYNNQFVGLFGSVVRISKAVSYGGSTNGGGTGVGREFEVELHYSATSPYASQIEDLRKDVRPIVFARGGDFNQSYELGVFNYVPNSVGTVLHWCAQIYGNTFVVARNCNFMSSYSAKALTYKSWDDASWTATLDGTTFTHAPGGDFSKAHTDTILNYQNNGVKWTMKL